MHSVSIVYVNLRCVHLHFEKWTAQYLPNRWCIVWNCVIFDLIMWIWIGAIIVSAMECTNFCNIKIYLWDNFNIWFYSSIFKKFLGGNSCSSEIKASFSHKPLVCLPRNVNYVTTQKTVLTLHPQNNYLKTQNQKFLLATLYLCQNYRYTRCWTERNCHVATYTTSHCI